MSGSNDGTIIVWNAQKRQEKFVLNGHDGVISSIVFSRDGKYIVSGCYDTIIKLWNFQEKKKELSLAGHTGRVLSVDISHDGKYIVSGSVDKNIKVWNIQVKCEEFSLIGHTSLVSSVKLSLDGNYIVSGSEDCTIKVWSFQERCELFTLNGHIGRVSSVEFSRNNKYIVSGSYDRTIKVWNVLEKREDFSLKGHTNNVLSVGFSPDCKYIVSGSADNTIKIWNIEEKREEFTLNGHQQSVLSVKFSSNGKYIASGSGDKYLKVWDIQGNRETFESNGQIFDSNRIEFSWEGGVSISEPGPLLSPLQNELLIYQKFNNVNVKFERKFFDSLNQLSPQFTKDPYFQDFIKYKQVSQLINQNKIGDISPELADLFFTIAMYRPTHIAAFIGDKNTLKYWLLPESNLIFKADLYGKSPFFYSILRGNQECTQVMMEYFISLKPSKKQQLEASMHSIRNDFQFIIKNSSSLLPEFINRILLQSDYVEIPETQKFPYLKKENVFAHDINSFNFPKDSKKILGIIKYSAFSIDTAQYSHENITMLESIRDCKNKNIFECFFIKEYIDYNWNGVIFLVRMISFMQIFTIFTFIVALVGRPYWYLQILFAIVYFMQFVWEILQMISLGLKNYFKDYWNWVESMTPLVVIYWLLSYFLNFSSEYESFLIAIILMIRGLTAFKAVNGTRYYVRLILASLNDIKYFIIVFFYSTLLFSVVITIAQNDDFDFETLWNQSWELNFGGQIDMNSGNNTLIYITVVVARIVNVVLMLNMLISILGDSYDNFLLERHIIDYREKLELVIEIQKMMFFKRVCGEKKHLHFLVLPYEDNQEAEDWQGKILYMERKQEKKIQVLSDKIAEYDLKNYEKLSSVETKIESKISGVEDKIENLEKKINGIDSDMKKILEYILKK